MAFSKKSVLIVIILVFIASCVSLYTLSAHIIAARFIYEDPEAGIWWRTRPSGSLFPWPRGSGSLQVISEVNEVDLFIYRNLIKPWILVGLSIMTWALAVAFVLKVIQSNLYKPMPSRDSTNAT